MRDHDLALSASRNALAAYESLQVRAPDYAEIHNNLALTYTRLGMPAMTMHSMRRAYQLHGHRRSDYIRQAFSISPLGGGFDALHIIWQDRLQGFPEAGRSDQLVRKAPRAYRMDVRICHDVPPRERRQHRRGSLRHVHRSPGRVLGAS